MQCRKGLVAELLEDGQGLLAAAVGLGLVTPVLGEDDDLPQWDVTYQLTKHAASEYRILQDSGQHQPC
jgi:hypothetical protein